MIIKIDKAGRTIVSNKPEFDENRVFTPAQMAQQEKFRNASVYAKDLELYIEKAKGSPQHPYNVAMADWLHPPEIKEINLAGWTGQAGQSIFIQAVDDVEVQRVSVVITDEDDAVLEQGLAVNEGSGWWKYQTTTTAAGNPKVLAASDCHLKSPLPAH